MSALEPQATPLTEQQARKLTDQAKQQAAALGTTLLRLHDGQAHRALGYESWHAYTLAEFGVGQSQSYRLLDFARVLEAVPQLGNAPESVGRVLAPTLKADGPQAARDTYEAAVEQHGPKPTAKQVKEAAVKRKKPPAPAKPVSRPAAAPQPVEPEDAYSVELREAASELYLTMDDVAIHLDEKFGLGYGGWESDRLTLTALRERTEAVVEAAKTFLEAITPADEAAEAMGASPRDVIRARHVKEQDSEVFEQIKTGELSLDEAEAKLADEAGA